MKPSLQEYYEDLVSKQPDSVKRFLLKNQLVKYKKAFVWLSEADRDFIRNGYEKGLELRAGYFFNKLCRNFRTGRRGPVMIVVREQKGGEEIDFPPLDIILQESDLLSLQKKGLLLFQNLFWPTRKFLSAQGIHGIEQLIPYIKGEKSVGKLLENCIGARKRTEICAMLQELRQEVEDNQKVKTEQSIDVKVDDNKCQDGNYIVIGHTESQADVINYSPMEIDIDKLEIIFIEWHNKLSVRAKNVLRANGITSYKKWKSSSEKEYFSFRNLKNCGEKTAKELMAMADDLKKKEILAIQSNDNKINKIHIFDKKITSFSLSPRAHTFLKEANIKTIGDLASLNKEDILKLKYIGRKTTDELGGLLKALNLSFGMKENVFLYRKKANPTIDPILFEFSREDRDYSIYFKERTGYLPLVFLLYKILSKLTGYEESVFKLFYGINPPTHITIDQTNRLIKSGLSPYNGKRPQPLSVDEIATNINLSRERIRQILVTAQKSFISVARNLCNHKDWQHYGIDNSLQYIWELDSNTQRALAQEKMELITYMQKRIPEEKRDTYLKENPIIDKHLFYVLLQGLGMRLYWIDFSRNEINSYAPSKSNSPTKKRSSRNANPPRSDTVEELLINDHFESFKFNESIKEVVRLNKVKTEEDILIPLKSYFIENTAFWSVKRKLSDYEKGSLERLLIKLFEKTCDASFKEGNLYVKANKIDFAAQAYELLKTSGTRLHRDELYKRLKKVCIESGGRFKFSDSTEILHFLTRDPRIVPVGKSGYWELKEWGNKNGSIREIALEIMKKSREPIYLEELSKMILEHRPDSNMHSVYSVIRQTASAGELLLFYNDYIGYPKKKYNKDYILMPQSFDDWLQAYKGFVEKSRRHPYSNQDYEGYLYRWHYRSRQYTDLTSDEILKFDALEKELAYYPQNATEYDFLQNCNLYKKFVESNKRMLTKDDDIELFNWFYKTSRNYGNYDDNRNKYFTQLLQYTSKLLY